MTVFVLLEVPYNGDSESPEVVGVYAKESDADAEAVSREALPEKQYRYWWNVVKKEMK